MKIADRVALRSARSWLRKLERGEYWLVGLEHVASARLAIGLALVAFFEKLNATRRE